MLKEIKDLREWVAKNEEHFADYSVEEIAKLAIACGFNPVTVEMWKASERFKRAS